MTNGIVRTLKRTRHKGIPRSRGEVVFDSINVLIMLFLMFITFYPFWIQIVLSICIPQDVYSLKPRLFPSGLSTAAYRVIFHYKPIWSGYRNTAFLSVVCTVSTVVLTFISAYPLTKNDLPFRKLFTKVLTATMFFGGGLIPTFLLIKSLGWRNTYWSLIVPGCIGTYNIFLCRNFIKTLPAELEESAFIDGAGQLRILFQIIMPLCLPILATIGLWRFVGEWQSWYGCLLYIDDVDKQTLGLAARKTLVRSDLALLRETAMSYTSDNSGFGVDMKQLNAGIIVVTVAPMLAIYPFFQQYFVKGIIIGAVKG